jgi:protein-tyrosine phosphatase
MTRIEPHLLWIGHLGDARNIAALMDAGIEAVLQLAFEEPGVVLPRELISLRVPLQDGSENNPAQLQFAMRILTDLLTIRRATLVCCSAGVSRSPALAAIALANIEGGHPNDWLLRIQQSVPTDVSPGLWGQLMNPI